MSDWNPIKTLLHDNDVILGKWYEDDCGGYYGESRWVWIASGCKLDEGGIWIDFTDDQHSGVSHQEPTHWQEIDKTPPKP